MKRILKFRAWDSDKKVMIFDFHPTANYTIFQTQVNDKFICGGTMQNGDWNEPDLMQYTGLKDKNGKEIYESDILITPCNETRYTKRANVHGQGAKTMIIESTGKVVCKWVGYGFKFDHLVKNKHSINIPEIEIIGNIHENPELLK